MCFTKDVVPRETPLTKAPGPRVSPSYGSLKKSAIPFPMLLTKLAGLPRISRDPTTHPIERDKGGGKTLSENNNNKKNPTAAGKKKKKKKYPLPSPHFYTKIYHLMNFL